MNFVLIVNSHVGFKKIRAKVQSLDIVVGVGGLLLTSVQHHRSLMPI